ncbi:hypothetical protein Taro_008175 [Colocasia esculenta]|uniref:Protein kinase domain-containing protein n=1 Tax=Colocasia esculenta TaxID=4460 RepID=A0A843TWV8_COLES|nr:hypothetical protein [Colocasia esculenta]
MSLLSVSFSDSGQHQAASLLFPSTNPIPKTHRSLLTSSFTNKRVEGREGRLSNTEIPYSITATTTTTQLFSKPKHRHPRLPSPGPSPPSIPLLRCHDDEILHIGATPPPTVPMSPPGSTPLVLLFLALLTPLATLPSGAVASPLSTVAISHVFNQTIVCALVPSGSSYTLNCTALPLGVTQSYASGAVSYSAIAAGNGFLCALTAPPSSPVATMRWWDLASEKPGMEPLAKRIYRGEPLAELGAGDSHVCGLLSGSREVYCWRWPEFASHERNNLTGIAVGGNFVCGLTTENRTIRCFGNDSNVVGKQPNGTFRTVAAGSRHACAVSMDGTLACWGSGAPQVKAVTTGFVSLALGDNRTCALRRNGTAECWGDGISLPDNLRQSQFLSIQAKGCSFCGVLVANYSLICWGNEIFAKKPVVFRRVLPGPCSKPTDCSCGILPGSGPMCSGGAVICSACEIESTPSPPPPSNTTGSSSSRGRRGEGRRRSVLFIVLGSVGLGFGVAVASSFLYCRFCRGSRCGQVHDSGRLDEEAPQLRGLPAIAAGAREPADPVAVPERLREFLRKGHSSTIEEFPLQVLLEVTDGFSDGHKIGSGSFGVVYLATLEDGRVVAIKRAEPCSSSSRYPGGAVGGTIYKRQEDKEQAFLSELALLSRVNHKNLVRLLGFCTEAGERVLLYEYMANGTLHDHLHKQLPRYQQGSPLAAWDVRLRVALDAARGIEYLHRYAVPPIIHRDIKSSNILLDDAWTAKVSDFGLSLMGPEDDASHLSLRAAGTVGYMDPEYYRLQYLTAKSDVYSFGVVLLELLTGFKAIHQEESGGGDDEDECCGVPRNVVDYAVPRIDADEVHKLLDPKLPPPKPSEIEAVQGLAHLAADCVCPEGRNRPTMSEIVSTLEWAVATYSAPPPLPRSMTTRSV